MNLKVLYSVFYSVGYSGDKSDQSHCSLKLGSVQVHKFVLFQD